MNYFIFGIVLDHFYEYFNHQTSLVENWQSSDLSSMHCLEWLQRCPYQHGRHMQACWLARLWLAEACLTTFVHTDKSAHEEKQHYRQKCGNVLGCRELRAVMLQWEIQQHPGQYLHQLLQCDVVGVPVTSHTLVTLDRFEGEPFRWMLQLTWESWSQARGGRSWCSRPSLSAGCPAPPSGTLRESEVHLSRFSYSRTTTMLSLISSFK